MKRQRRDADTGGPGKPWKHCTRPAVVKIWTKGGVELCYCDEHKARANDTTGRYHSGAASTLSLVLEPAGVNDAL